MPVATFRSISLSTLVLALALTVLAGCGSNKASKKKQNKPVGLESFERQVKLEKKWTRDLGKGQGKDYYRLSLGVSPDGVCAASIEGKVACYDHNGRKQWKHRIDGDIAAGVGVAENFVLLVDTNGELHVLNRQSGKPVWSKNLSSEVLAAPQGNNEIFVVQTTDGRVIGLSADTGKKRWEYQTDEPRLTLRGTATPVIDRDVVYTGFANGKLVGLSMDNAAVIFNQPVAIPTGTAEIDRIVDIDASPTLTIDSIYSASFNGNLFAFDKRNSRPRWRVKTSTYRGLAKGLNKVYLVDEKSQLIAYAEANGEERWLQSAFRNRDLSSPAVFAGYLLVADYKGYLHVLSEIDGEIVGRARVDRASVRVPMRAYQDQLYVYSDDGKLAAYTLKVIAS